MWPAGVVVGGEPIQLGLQGAHGCDRPLPGQPFLEGLVEALDLAAGLGMVGPRVAVAGIEIKAASTVRSEDFAGLRRLADKLGEDFLVGIVLYSGTATLPFGPKFRALPASAIWQL